MTMPFIEELPKKKIQDFFAEGDPERTSQKPHTKQAKKKDPYPCIQAEPQENRDLPGR